MRNRANGMLRRVGPEARQTPADVRRQHISRTVYAEMQAISGAPGARGMVSRHLDMGTPLPYYEAAFDMKGRNVLREHRREQIW